MRIFLCSIIILVLTSLAADSGDPLSVPENILPSKITLSEKNQLLSEHEINRYLSKEVQPELFPNTVLSREIKRNALNSRYTIGVESIFLIPIPDSKLQKNIKETREKQKIRLFNILRSISTLEGITYYSESKKKIRTLYTKSYAIDNPYSKKRIEDPLVNQTLPLSTVYMFQKDASFGKTIYRILYKTAYNEISLSMKNVVKFQRGIFTLVGKDKMRLFILVYPLENCFLFYGLCIADVSSSNSMKKKLNRSFSNRILAYRKWFGEMIKN